MSVTNAMSQPAENKWALKPEETTEEYRATSNAFGPLIVTLIALVLVGLAYLGYFTWKKTNIQITQLFGNQAAVNTLGQRVATAESTLLDETGRWNGIAQRVTMLESQINRNVRQTRKYAEGLADQLHQQVTAEIQARTSVLDARLGQVESGEEAQRLQLARVESELQQQISSAGEETSRHLSSIHQQIDDTSRNLDSLSQRLDRERVDFEVSKGQTRELIPGVSLQISRTNNQYQRFRGSLWLLQDRQTLWLRDESINEPVRFYHKEGGEPYELVVTSVTGRSVVGYLLFPKEQPPAAAYPHNVDAIAVTAGDD